jgi:hypothetical protein
MTTAERTTLVAQHAAGLAEAAPKPGESSPEVTTARPLPERASAVGIAHPPADGGSMPPWQRVHR